MSTISKKYQKSHTMTLEQFNRGTGMSVLLGILFFFVLCLGAADSIRMTVMVVAFFTLFIIAARFKILRDRIYWPFIALTLVVLMDGISTFYAVSGKFALREFLKVFLAYLMAVILLATSPKEEEVKGKRIATILAVCTGIGSLVSIDLISTRWISGAVTWVLGHFTEAYKDLSGVLVGSRITSLFTNPNVFSGFSGLGVLLSFGLTGNAASRKEHCCFAACLFLNFLAFILALSRAAVVFLTISLLVILLLENKEKRLARFLVIIETVILAAGAAVLTSKTSFREWDGIQPVPLLCAVVGTVLLCLADSFIQNAVTPRITVANRRTVSIIIAAVLIIAAVFPVLALSLHKDIILSEGDYFRRALYPDSGTYTLEVQTDGNPLYVRVLSQNQQEAMMGTNTQLFYGSAYDAIFTVPEDSLVIYFTFSTTDKTHIYSIKCGDIAIPLKYILLPEFIAYRLQGVLASENAIQRMVFFSDGLKLFRRSPIVGLGMGAFENGIKSVQTYYYETKYAHNHYFQTLLETGVVGLLLFLAALVSSALTALRSRKTHPYAPMLGAAILFMALHALTEIVFSAYAYLPIAFGVLALNNHCCGMTISIPKVTRAFNTAFICVISATTIIYSVFLAGNIMAKRNIEVNPSLQTLTRCVELDKFEWADYALPYVTNAVGDNTNEYVRKQADVYAERLAKVNSNTIPIYLAEYYFSSARLELGFSMIEKYVDYVSSDQSAWQRAFDLLQVYNDDSRTFYDGVIRLSEKLKSWNSENLGVITLDEETIAFITSCKAQ